jgi:hypothetical protein
MDVETIVTRSKRDRIFLKRSSTYFIARIGQLNGQTAGSGGLADAALAAAKDPLQRLLRNEILQRRLEEEELVVVVVVRCHGVVVNLWCGWRWLLYRVLLLSACDHSQHVTYFHVAAIFVAGAMHLNARGKIETNPAVRFLSRFSVSLLLSTSTSSYLGKTG